MWYVSESVSDDIKKLSNELLAKHGPKTELIIARKHLGRFADIMIDYQKVSLTDFIKVFVDSLIVIQHLINVENITWDEIEAIGTEGYTNSQGCFREGKIARTYFRAFDERGYESCGDFQSDLDTLARRTFDKFGAFDQINLASEEIYELQELISKHNRGKPDRPHLIGEVFDVLFTFRYLLIEKERQYGMRNLLEHVNDFAKSRITIIRAEHCMDDAQLDLF
ncbi:MAG: hypothetical protein FWG18_02160 [Alphaproteobacteria bacterium]|nr:hypothetical protein [Alphaproteobacteria bacterium]